MRRQTNSGKIAVRPRQGKIHTTQLDKDRVFGFGETFLHCEATRTTEEEALGRPPNIPKLDELQRQIATLERIGRDPQNYMLDYPVRDRPERAIFGSALWAWIGRQPGITMTAKDVGRWLKRISEVEQARADMKLDSDYIKMNQLQGDEIVPSKNDLYYQSLVDQYKTTVDAIRVFEEALVHTLATSEAQQEYRKNIQKREKLLQAMGIEFPAVFARLNYLKSKPE